MKIAQFVTADVSYPVPGNEVFASFDTTHLLVESLVRAREDVTLYAVEGTQTSAHLVTHGIKASRTVPRLHGLAAVHGTAMLSYIAKEYEQYDVIHLHTLSLSALSFARLMPRRPVVITLHDPLNVPLIQASLDLHQDLSNVHYVSISNNQRITRPDLNYAATIYHGLVIENIPWSKEPTNRWIFFGRIILNKGADIAVKIAIAAGIGLDIVGPNYLEDDANRQYFNEKIAPYVDGEKIRYFGTKSHDDIKTLLPKARGFLFPLQWEEPFGLTVIEALAAGTPTLGFKRGSLPEIIEHGKTGFLVDTEQQMIQYINKIDSIRREDCRKAAEDRFSMSRVTNQYLELYKKLHRG